MGDRGEQDAGFRKREEKALRNIDDLYKEYLQFKEDVPRKSKSLKDHIHSLYEIAGAMDSTHKSATIAGFVGAGISVTGGLVSIAGAALALFTGGASLVATVGVGTSFFGGFTRVAGSAVETVGHTNSKKKVDEILMSCVQELQTLEDNYDKVQEKIRILENQELKKEYRDALEKMKCMFYRYEPALKREMFKLALRSIVHLTARLLSRRLVEKLSQKASQTATKEIAEEFAKEMYKNMPKRWYHNVARTSAVASGVASLVFLPLDVRDFCTDVTHLHKGAQSELAQEIRNVAGQLDALISHLR